MEILFSLVFASLIAFSSSVGVPVGARAPSGSLAHPYLALENRMEEKPRRQGVRVQEKLLRFNHVCTGRMRKNLLSYATHVTPWRRRRSRKGRCDIFLKFDISLLTNNNLRHDELAEVAYFVRALREVEL